MDRIPERILVHKRYNDDTLEYDVALVKIKKVEITSHIKPISLPDSKLCHDRKRKKRIKRKAKKKKVSKGQQGKKRQKNRKKTVGRERKQSNGKRGMKNGKKRIKTQRQGAHKDKRLDLENDYSFKVSRFKYILKHERTCWVKKIEYDE